MAIPIQVKAYSVPLKSIKDRAITIKALPTDERKAKFVFHDSHKSLIICKFIAITVKSNLIVSILNDFAADSNRSSLNLQKIDNSFPESSRNRQLPLRIREYRVVPIIIIKIHFIMQSETLFAIIGKIRVQRIRLSSQPGMSTPGPWTTEEEVKFEDVNIKQFSSSNSMAQISDSSTPTSPPDPANK